MPKEQDKPSGTVRIPQIQRLTQETGITEAEATELVNVLGTDWASLVREAEYLKKAKR